MRIFKSKKTDSCCGASMQDLEQAITQPKTKGIKILGSGCAKCNTLESNVKEALSKLQMNEEIEHVTDFAVIASYGVMSTPALVIDSEVVAYGKVLSIEEAIAILKKYRN